jgi:hypothetical protein
LPGVGEHEYLASAKGGKSGGLGGVCGLYLYLLGNKCLKWLVALRLVVLNRRAPETSYLSATSARNELTPRFKILIDFTVVI